MPHEHLHRWYSPSLSRDIDVLAFGHRGFPVILFPTSMGNFYENKDAGLIESVSWFLNEGLIKIYCPDGIDTTSWYNKNIHPADRVKNHIWYDQMLRNELWRASRYGIDGMLIDFGKQQQVDTRELIHELLLFVDDVVDELGSRQTVNYVKTILTNGTGADRQLKVFEQTQSLQSVVDYITDQTLVGI